MRQQSVWHSAQKIIGDFINVSKLDNAEMRLPKFREVYNVCQFFMKVFTVLYTVQWVVRFDLLEDYQQ